MWPGGRLDPLWDRLVWSVEWLFHLQDTCYLSVDCLCSALEEFVPGHEVPTLSRCAWEGEGETHRGGADSGWLRHQPGDGGRDQAGLGHLRLRAVRLRVLHADGPGGLQ